MKDLVDVGGRAVLPIDVWWELDADAEFVLVRTRGQQHLEVRIEGDPPARPRRAPVEATGGGRRRHSAGGGHARSIRLQVGAGDRRMTRRPNDLLLVDVLEEHAARTPERSAVRCAGVDHSWHDLRRRVAQLAEVLRGAGVGPHDRVAWVAQNCHRYLETLLACASDRRHVRPAELAPERRRAALDAGRRRPPSRAVAGRGDRRHRRRPARAPPVDATWVQLDAEPSDPDGYEGRLGAMVGATLPTEPDVRADEPVLLLYTAAFDGRPAGALLTQAGLLLQAWYGIHFGGATPADVYLNAGPLFHVGTLKATLATFLAGGVNVFVARVDAEELCQVIDRERCTGAFLQPPTIDAMVVVNADGRYDLSSLRAKPGPAAWNAMVSTGAADPLPQRLRPDRGRRRRLVRRRRASVGRVSRLAGTVRARRRAASTTAPWLSPVRRVSSPSAGRSSSPATTGGRT